MKNKFIKAANTYVLIDQIESVNEYNHLDKPVVHVNTKSGKCHVMPSGVKAAFIIEMLIQGGSLDVEEEQQRYTEGL